VRLGATLAHLSDAPPFAVAAWADRLVTAGFESLWTPEIIGRGALVPDPFVVPASGRQVDDALRALIVDTLRTRLTPRHVPDEIVAAPAVPHTLSGKKLEVPIKKLLRGTPLAKAANIASVDDPDALRWYERFAADRD